MTSTRPYLIRAFYEWITDNQLTPHLVVDATMPETEVPLNYVQNGKIILNIDSHAVRDLRLGNDGIHFNARFGSRSVNVSVPPAAVIAIYAKENGQGMIFKENESDLTSESVPAKPTKPSLKLVD